MRYSKGTYKLWFNYLQLAIRRGVPVNWRYYAEWGTKDELLSTTFNRWWKTKGIALFAADPESQRGVVEVQNKGDGYVILKIATDAPMALVSRRVGEIVRGARTARRTRAFGKFAPKWQVNYKTLAIYKRLLEISLAPENANLSVAERIDLLKEQYGKIHGRMRKQREALRKEGEEGRRVANLWHSHDPGEFDVTDKQTKMKLEGLSVKKAHRWMVSGQLVMLNVAEGKFPGDGYYGAKIGEKLRDRMRAIGLRRDARVDSHQAGGEK